MTKKTWVTILSVSIVTILIIVYGVMKFTDQDKENEYVNSGDLTDKYEEQKEEQESKDKESKEDKGEEGELDVAKEQTNNLEDILKLSEGSLVSKDQLQEDIKEWKKEGIIDGENDNQGIADKIKSDYGSIELESYLSSQLVSSEMSKEDIQQLAIGFSMDEITDEKVYYDLKPFEKIKNSLNGEIEREPQIMIGGDSDNVDEVDKYYYKDTKGFEDVKGNELGYYELVFYDDTENTIKLFGDLGAEHEEIGDLLGFNIVYHMKLDEEYSEEEIKDKISEIEINGNTGERMFELLSSQDEYIYPKDSILKVNVPVTSEDLFGEKDDLQARSKWSKGKTDELEIKINGEKVKLKGHTKEEYLEGVTVEK